MTVVDLLILALVCFVGGFLGARYGVHQGFLGFERAIAKLLPPLEPRLSIPPVPVATAGPAPSLRRSEFCQDCQDHRLNHDPVGGACRVVGCGCPRFLELASDVTPDKAVANRATYSRPVLFAQGVLRDVETRPKQTEEEARLRDEANFLAELAVATDSPAKLAVCGLCQHPRFTHALGPGICVTCGCHSFLELAPNVTPEQLAEQLGYVPKKDPP